MPNMPRSLPMLIGGFAKKYFWIIFTLLLGASIIILVHLYSSDPNRTIYAVGCRNLELILVVTDKDTGQPIPNASIEITAEGRQENYEPRLIAILITDKSGAAIFFREQNKCEDVIRSFRKTVTLIDLTWATVTIKAESYETVEQLWLEEIRLEKNEWVSEWHLQRVELRLPLKKRADK